jgi:type IX secretion system PorP/SprF family membrane protein
MKNKYILLALLLVAVMSTIKAQVDPHFSQYYANPLWLNPALTGVMNADMRVNANYKNQWPSINAYRTGAVSADFKPQDQVGVGLTVLDQSAGGGRYNYLTAYGSFGYGIRLSDDGNKRLSFGLQVGVINRRFDMSGLQFGNQFEQGSGFNSGMNSNENIQNNNTTVFDANGGIFYYDGDPSKTFNLFGGVSAAHLTRPRDKFTVNDNTRLPIRYAAHGGVRIKASEFVDITPHLLYIRQQNASIAGAGLYSEIKVLADQALILGGMYRFDDAAIANVGYRFSNLVVGLSYDINTSALTNATNAQGGLEISLSYVFRKRVQQPEPVCPRL